MKKITLYFICFVFIFSVLNPAVYAAANTGSPQLPDFIVFETNKKPVKNSNTDVRIGLKSKHSDIKEITIKNTSLIMGYCINGSYIGDMQLKSSSGFKFTPDTNEYVVMSETYYSYSAALTAAKKLSLAGVKAYPAIVYRNMWKVYAIYNDNKNLNIESFKFKPININEIPIASGKEKIKVTADGTEFIIDAEKKQAYPQFRAGEANSSGDYVINIGSDSYRGRMEIGRYSKNLLTAVNIINIESYLYGVVPSEMPSSWHAEALKAQAVCARSYALSKSDYYADSIIKSPYKIDDTTDSQVYKGYNAEKKRTTDAVNATKGQVLTYNGNIITAFFFSTSGGRTENIKYVWGGNAPYFKSISDIYETEPERSPWILTYSPSRLEELLNKGGYNTGAILTVYPIIVTDSNRVYTLRAKGNNRSYIINGTKVREMLGLYSTKFKIITKNDNPDLVYAQSKDGTYSTELNSSYVISAGGKVNSLKNIADTNAKSGYNTFQYIAKGADNEANYPAYAPSDNSYAFAGMGYGHGVGMSQSGAKVMAENGINYKEILSAYYYGTKITQK